MAAASADETKTNEKAKAKIDKDIKVYDGLKWHTQHCRKVLFKHFFKFFIENLENGQIGPKAPQRKKICGRVKIGNTRI